MDLLRGYEAEEGDKAMKTALRILIPATALLYFPLAFEEFETPKTYALVAFGCFAFCFMEWSRLAHDRIAQAIALFCVSAAASTALSVDRHMSMFGNSKAPMGLLVIISYFTVYMGACEVLESGAAEKVIDIILACSSIVSIYAVSQALGFDFKQWNGTLYEAGYTRPMSTLGHPNFMANYLAMTLPFALYRLFGANRKWILLYCVLICVSVVAVVMSLSRGMILATAISTGAYFIMSTKSYKRAAAFMCAASIVAGVTIFAVPRFKTEAVHRLDAFMSPGPARLEYPKGAVRIWRRCPWFGTGTDTFEIAFRNQRTPFYWSIERGGSPHRAHNDFLNILATQGILGALAGILVTLAIWLKARRVKSQLGYAAIASILAFYVAGLTSFTIAATGTLFMICAAVVHREGALEDDISPLVFDNYSAFFRGRTPDASQSAGINNQTLWPY